MDSQVIVLCLTAMSIGLIHTLLGPDHYLPFVVLAKARKWSIAKTMWITAVCGVGHITGSAVLGTIGIVFGLAISKIHYFESIRGNITGWLLILFGFSYAVWGVFRLLKSKAHTHKHLAGVGHHHLHEHSIEHTHPSEDVPDSNVVSSGEKTEYKNLTPWLLFVIFIFGPCEPLIPLFMYPAYQHNTFGMVLVTSVFGLVTIATMLAMVSLMTLGFQFIHFKKFEKFTHTLAGATIFLSGIAMQFLGL